MLDTFEYINPVLSESIARGYLISTKFTPKVYGRIYHTAEAIEKNNAKISVSKLISSILSKKLVTFLREYNMDVIVCTHIFAAQIVSYLQSAGMQMCIRDSINPPPRHIITLARSQNDNPG